MITKKTKLNAGRGLHSESAVVGGLSEWNPTAWCRYWPSATRRDVRTALLAMQQAKALLSALANKTDDPPSGVVEVADLIDVALACLSVGRKAGDSHGQTS